jgi:RluA family pseudouridine synthase
MAAPIPILFSDEHLAVVDKPAGLLSVPDLARALSAQGLAAEPVHRLDREVSGCLLVTQDEETRAALEDAFRERRVAKTYWALVRGTPRRMQGEIKYPLLHEGRHARVSARGQAALTRYRVLRRLACERGEVSECEIELVTGRYNQIRVHFAHDGHALVGERKYARGADDPLGAKRLALHAWRLAFDHPRSGARIAVEAPLPADLLLLLDSCRPLAG